MWVLYGFSCTCYFCCIFFNVFGFSLCFVHFFFFKQKTAYEMRISDWSSDVCSSDLASVFWVEVETPWSVRRVSLDRPSRPALRSADPDSGPPFPALKAPDAPIPALPVNTVSRAS